MSRTKKAWALAALALVAVPAGAAGPGQTVKVKSEVTLKSPAAEPSDVQPMAGRGLIARGTL